MRKNGLKKIYGQVWNDRDKVFINEGRKHDGKTHGWIMDNDSSYIIFSRDRCSTTKKKYEKLIKFYEFIQSMQNEQNF